MGHFSPAFGGGTYHKSESGRPPPEDFVSAALPAISGHLWGPKTKLTKHADKVSIAYTLMRDYVFVRDPGDP